MTYAWENYPTGKKTILSDVQKVKNVLVVVVFPIKKKNTNCTKILFFRGVGEEKMADNFCAPLSTCQSVFMSVSPV